MNFRGYPLPHNDTDDMKKRQAKKQIKKIIGIMPCCGQAVYNFVSNPRYNGGSCIELDEDCCKSEIIYRRKRHGAPLLLRNRWRHLLSD